MKKGIFAVFLAIICTFVFYGIRYTKKPLQTVTAKLGTYDESVYTKAFFVRDERVYTASTEGTVYNHFSDGTRIKKDALITSLYQGEVDDKTLQELNTIDKKIENAKNTIEYVVADDSDSENVENRIETYKKEIVLSAVNDDVLKISQYKNAINSLRNGNANKNVETVVSELTSEKEKIEGTIDGSKKDYFSETSGIFTTVLDGMEHILTPEKVKEFTVRDFNNIQTVTGKTANQIVSAGDSLCKVVNNHRWYVIATVAEERVVEKKLNLSVTMRFDNIPGEEVRGKIIYYSEPQDGKVLVLIESTEYLENAYSFRESNMELVFNMYKGYRLPVYAIRTEDNQKGVMGKRNNVESFYPCTIIYTNTDAGYCIVATPKDSEKKLEDVQSFVIGER